MHHLTNKVLLIGWDAADWKFLDPLIDQGLMPNLEGLLNGGVRGRLATLDPPLSPMLWTSIATGKRPYKHGIHGFTEPDPSGEGIRPVNITARSAKAIWNILTQHNLKTNVVGWWPSHPAEPVNGVYISDFYHRATGNIHEPWPMMKGTVYPAEMSELFANLRIHPEELTAAHLGPFMPDAGNADPNRDKRIYALAKILAECSTIHSAATYIMEHTEWDFMGVYYDAIDHFGHGFMKYHPPRRNHISLADYEMYKYVVSAACRYHDMMLGRLLQIAGEETTVILISDHGFHPDHNRPRAIPDEPAGPAVEHSPYGIIVMKGPAIKNDETVFGASLLDITPTLLTLFGLPVAEDMDGKVLVHAFEEMPMINTIKSWENIKGNDGTHPAGFAQSREDLKAELQQLIDLGYVEDPGDNVEEAIQRTKDENNYFLARAYLDGGEYAAGIQLLELLHIENPQTLRYADRLVHVYLSVGKYKEARITVNHIREIVDRETPELDILEGNLLLAEQRYQKALELFQKAEREGGSQPMFHLRIAHAYLQLNKLDDAEIAIRKELEINAEQSSAYHLLGIILFQQMRYEEALAVFMDAIGLLYYSPASHYYIGETLIKIRKFELAAEAFDVTLRQAPGMNKARQQLINIYENHLQQPGAALKYKQEFQDSIQGSITIVSGLPRSGTSMMMQMLEAAGLPIFTDKERTADESNPKGYYEHEAVKSLKRNKKWLPDAKDKVVKVVAQLLQHLPMTYQYKLVFMEREVLEVIASQQKMLIRKGRQVQENALPVKLLEQYRNTLDEVKKWAEACPNVEILYVPYKETIENTFMQAMLVNDFLGGQLPVEKMVQVVDENLYREKI